MQLSKDLARCADDGTCPLRETCARYKDTVSTEPIWWTAFAWEVEDGKPTCFHFIEFKP